MAERKSAVMRIEAKAEGLDAVAMQAKRVVKAARKLDREIGRLAGMGVTVRVRPERLR